MPWQCHVMPWSAVAYAMACSFTCHGMPWHMPRHAMAYVRVCNGICHTIRHDMPWHMPWHALTCAMACHCICQGMPWHMPWHDIAYALASCLSSRTGRGGRLEQSQWDVPESRGLTDCFAMNEFLQGNMIYQRIH